MLYRVDTDHHTIGIPESIFYVEAETITAAISTVNAYNKEKYNHEGKILNVAVLTDVLLRTPVPVVFSIIGARDLGEAEEVPSENG